MCTYNVIRSHADHFEIQKRDSEESLLTFVNLFPSILYILNLSVMLGKYLQQTTSADYIFRCIFFVEGKMSFLLVFVRICKFSNSWGIHVT